jgi:hypothetical protein
MSRKTLFQIRLGLDIELQLGKLVLGNVKTRRRLFFLVSA